MRIFSPFLHFLTFSVPFTPLSLPFASLRSATVGSLPFHFLFTPLPLPSTQYSDVNCVNK